MVGYVLKSSLSETLDRLNEALFYGRDIPAGEKKEAALWIAGRQGLPGAYRDSFAITPQDEKEGARVFTGEKMTHASARHIMGEEAARMLALLAVNEPQVKSALRAANAGISNIIKHSETKEPHTPGMYCCGKCSVSLWRNLASGNMREHKHYIADGMKVLERHRDGDGKWGRFPFWYTVLALHEIKHPLAAEELAHARQVVERYVKPGLEGGKYMVRRRELAKRVLELKGG